MNTRKVMAGYRIFLSGCALLFICGWTPSAAKPIVDPGLFVIQGVTSCINGTGYCLLGSDCSVDVEFLPDNTGGHCHGLREAFTPKIDFICCKYNPLGKETSKPPTTTISSFTITDVFSLIDEEVVHQQESDDEFPEDFDPENVIDIVGVVTDFTGIIGLVTRPWTGTFPTKASSPTTTPMTPTQTTTSSPISPATPADVDQIMFEMATEETTTETPTEATESYNEAPTEIDGSSIPDQQDSQTTPEEQENNSTPTSHQSENVEVAQASIVITNDSTSTQRPALTPVTVTTGDPFDMNVIVFPDNPILSEYPSLDVEALEAVTDSIVHANTVGNVIDVIDSNSVHETHTEAVADSATEEHLGSHVSDLDRLQQESEESQDSQQHSSAAIAVIDQDEVNNLPEDSDYDYYSEYADQLLLQPVNQNICGFKGYKNNIIHQSSSRIIGGVAASTVEWCWTAAIMQRGQGGDRFVCSGALVESDLVLTTAACLKRLRSREISQYIVVLGDSNLREDLPYGIQFHSIEEVVIHPDYFTSGGAHANDIGLVRLRAHATLSDNVCLVCMAQQDAIFPTQSCTVTGYGIGDVPRTMISNVKDVVPSDGILRQLSVPIMNTGTCRDALHNITGSEILATSDFFLCAGGLNADNACYSTMDGGSPLACEAGGRWFLAGVVSWTKDCEKQGIPNVYTRVSSFSNWLQATHLRMLGFLTHQIRLA